MNLWDAWADTVEEGSWVRTSNPSVLARVISTEHSPDYWVILRALDGSDVVMIRSLGSLSPPTPLEQLAGCGE